MISRSPDPSRTDVDLTVILLGGPKIDNDVAEIFAEIEAERKADFGDRALGC